MIVPDGRTDLEKLKELLGNPEQTHLDLKASVDMSSASDKLKFVKDAVAMASRPEGGYFLIGVDDNGNPCAPIGTIGDRARYDGSRVGALIRGYVEASVHAVVEIHEFDNHEIVVIYVHNPDRLPIPFNKAGGHPTHGRAARTLPSSGKARFSSARGRRTCPSATPTGPTSWPRMPTTSERTPMKPHCQCCGKSWPAVPADQATPAASRC
ncbi:RNA-binding domain-containing protein [Gordonia sp. NPDC003376]